MQLAFREAIINPEQEAVPDIPLNEQREITLYHVRQLVAWDWRNKRLKPYRFVYMKEIEEGKRPLPDYNKQIVRTNIERLE